MVECSICHKQLKTVQGLQGHQRFSHPGQPTETGLSEPASTPVTEDIQSDDGGVIAEALERLDDRISVSTAVGRAFLGRRGLANFSYSIIQVNLYKEPT